MRELETLAAPDAVFTCDAGNFATWPPRFMNFKDGQRFIGPTNGAMGYGVPAGIGAAIAYPGRQVVVFVGDGGMLMTGQEIATAFHHGVAPIVLVFNNAMYGTIRMYQERTYPGRVAGTALTNPDFARFMESFGGHGEVVQATEEFASGVPPRGRERQAGADRAAGEPGADHVAGDDHAVAGGDGCGEGGAGRSLALQVTLRHDGQGVDLGEREVDPDALEAKDGVHAAQSLKAPAIKARLTAVDMASVVVLEELHDLGHPLDGLQVLPLEVAPPPVPNLGRRHHLESGAGELVTPDLHVRNPCRVALLGPRCRRAADLGATFRRLAAQQPHQGGRQTRDDGAVLWCRRRVAHDPAVHKLVAPEGAKGRLIGADELVRRPLSLSLQRNRHASLRARI